MLRVRVAYSGIGGTPYLSTFYFNGTGSTQATDAHTGVTTFQNALDAVQDNGLTWRSDPQVVEMDPTTGAATASYSVTSATAVGALAVESLPFASQGLIRLRTGVYASGREIRGRLFVPGLTENANNDGAVVAATQTAVNAAAAALIADGTSEWVVWSRSNGTTEAITSATMWDQFATLRTRRPSF